MLLLTLTLLASTALAADTDSAFPAGIGPIRAALAQAKEWQKDVCLSGVEFWRTDSNKFHRPRITAKFSDQFALHFHSDAQPLESFTYPAMGRKDGAPGPRRGHFACLEAFELDAKAALAAATAAGFRVNEFGEVEASLGALNADVYITAKNIGRPLKPTKSKTAWWVKSEISSAVVDAVTGKVLAVSGRRGVIH